MSDGYGEILFAWRYRQSNKEATYTPDWDHSTQLELVIWAAPLLIIIALYLTINYAYYKVIGFDALKTSTNIAAIMASHVFGSAAGNILSVLETNGAN